MKFNLKKNISNFKELNKIKEEMSKIYADLLGIDEELAFKLISEKFNKHTNILSDKFDKSLTEENVKILKDKEDVDLNEYLKKKPIIKG